MGERGETGEIQGLVVIETCGVKEDCLWTLHGESYGSWDHGGEKDRREWKETQLTTTQRTSWSLCLVSCVCVVCLVNGKDTERYGGKKCAAVGDNMAKVAGREIITRGTSTLLPQLLANLSSSSMKFMSKIK